MVPSFATCGKRANLIGSRRGASGRDVGWAAAGRAARATDAATDAATASAATRTERGTVWRTRGHERIMGSPGEVGGRLILPSGRGGASRAAGCASGVRDA